jgi:hypothetical protein
MDICTHTHTHTQAILDGYAESVQQSERMNAVTLRAVWHTYAQHVSDAVRKVCNSCMNYLLFIYSFIYNWRNSTRQRVRVIKCCQQVH